MVRFEEFLAEWADFFLSERTFTVNAELDFKTAKIDGLKDDYKQLTQSLVNRVSSSEEHQECEIVASFINQLLDNPDIRLTEVLGPAGDKVRIKFELPILSARNLEKIKGISLQVQDTNYWALIGLAAIVFELQMLRTDVLATLSARNIPVFLFVFQQYAAIRLYKRYNSDGEIKRLIEDEASKTVKSKMDAQSSQFNELTHRIDSLQASATEVDDRLKADLYEATAKARGDIEDSKLSIIVSFKEDAANAVKEVKSSAHLEQARLEWKGKSYRHARSLLISTGILLLILILVPLFTILCHASIIEFIASVSEQFSSSLTSSKQGLFQQITNSIFWSDGSDPSHAPSLTVELLRQLGKLFFLTIPLIIYFWICRLLVRFVLRSLVLMDDANQRSIVLDTYLNLVGEGVAKEEDRQLLLQAISLHYRDMAKPG